MTDVLEIFPPITELVPHRPPMLLVDELVNADKTSAHCRAKLTKQHPFFDASFNGIPAWIGIELMAQTIATWAGYQDYLIGKTPAIGFLVGTRKYTSDRPYFPLDSTLDIKVEEVMNDGGMSVFACHIELEGQQVATCQLSTYEPSTEELENMTQGEIA